MLDPCNLSLLSDDPQLGIKAVTKCITIVLSSSNQVSIKENLCKLLSTSLNQYSPDIGGIVLGYSNISQSKVISKWSQGDSRDDIVTLKVAAKFYLFSPSVGSTLRSMLGRIVKLDQIMKNDRILNTE